MWNERSNPGVLQKIAERLKEYRLQQNTTQLDLAQNTGVSLNVIQRVETGKPVSTLNFIAVLRGLDLLENFDVAFPEPPVSPILLQRLKGKQRKRARNKE